MQRVVSSVCSKYTPCARSSSHIFVRERLSCISLRRGLKSLCFHGNKHLPGLGSSDVLKKGSIQPTTIQRCCMSSSDGGYSESNLLPYPLTRDETLSYLQTTLDIQNPEQLLSKDRAEFLQRLMQQVKQTTPFTNMTFLSFQEGPRLPSLSQCKDAMMLAQGGNCMVINTFVKAVLENLGFKTHQIPSSVYRWRDPLGDHHLALVVRDLTQTGSRHLVDVGNQFQICAPVSLDFRRASFTYKNRNVLYKYFQVSNGIIQFCQEIQQPGTKPGTSQLIFYEDDKWWEVLMTLRTMEEKNLSDALKLNIGILEAQNTSVLNDLLLVGYYKDLWVKMKLKKCMTMTSDGRVEITKIADNDHLTEMVLKYFPQFSLEQIQHTINNIDKCST